MIGPTMSANNGRFQLTTWPATALPLAHYRRFEDYEVVEVDGAVWILPVGHNRDDTPSGQTYLRTLEVDINDIESCLSFARGNGVFGLFRQYDGGLDWLEPLIRDEEPGSRMFGAFKGTWLHRELIATRPEAEASTLDLVRWLYGETLSEFRLGVVCLQLLARCQMYLQDQLDVSDLSVNLAFAEDIQLSERAPQILADGLTDGLRDFHPRIVAQKAESIGIVGAREIPGKGRSLYGLCCLELFNHVLQQTRYRHCANETCGRVYALDQWSTHRRARRDRIYCSRTCCNAQSKREARRRQAIPPG